MLHRGARALSLSLFSLLPLQGAHRPAAFPQPAPLENVDVPLARYVNGPDIGTTAGIAFLDYDGDGWIDFYDNFNAKLFRNESGAGWTRIADLDHFLPPIADRYGAACGDYDADGLPDIACEPRGDCFYLLHNLGSAQFQEVASDPLLVDQQPCGMDAETFCWADVDDDGDLDLWATAYPDSVQPGSGGNRFFENLGPTGPGGAYRFALRTDESGLGNPPNVQRPEGAQFVDADRDGDPDAYANGTFYQNRSDASGPHFHALLRNLTGITLPTSLDEGAMFFDYDLDGDQDLLVVYKGLGNRIWENRGDATFVDVSSAALEQPGLGATEGCSAEDWDLDGDLDITTGNIFRRNLLVETGQRFLRLATTSIPDAHLNFLTTAWGDWDKDGDPDAILANWRGTGRLYRNTSYEPTTLAEAKHTIRVRPVRDSALVARGLETEFGATVELRVHDDPSGFVRRRFVASSHGYLQQSEYALTMALPSGPDPAHPANGVVFDLAVDFPGRAERGVLRVDRTVNPALGGISLAALVEREITVFRSGIVRLDGVDYAPSGFFEAHMVSSGALGLADIAAPLAEVGPAPAPSWFVGLELDTSAAAGPLRVEELVLDGQLEPGANARCDANVWLWDVTSGAAPRALRTLALATSPRNARSFLPLSFFLKPQRVYRVLCRVTSLRASPLAALTGTPLANRGGLSFANPNPCDGDAVLGAALHADQAFLELRAHAGLPALLGKHAR